MIEQGEIISYLEMCREEGINLQRGMNFRLHNGFSVILMSVRSGAPYDDRFEEDGQVLIYEGHDVPRERKGPDPKNLDQPKHNPSGRLTQNGLFYEAAKAYVHADSKPELVKVYEKLRSGIWVYNGIFNLVNAWLEESGTRKVFKFKLELVSDTSSIPNIAPQDIAHNRLIPTPVKLEVWKRDKGRCVKCGSTDNLHFDHDIPYSKGGSSLVAENIQLLCARHNLSKRDKIE